jgi:hypothetical protein
VQGRARNKTDIDTFALALDILLNGLKQEITESRQRQASSHEKKGSA